MCKARMLHSAFRRPVALCKPGLGAELSTAAQTTPEGPLPHLPCVKRNAVLLSNSNSHQNGNGVQRLVFWLPH